MTQFGIIGKPLTHSFSPAYFNRKFEELGLSKHEYGSFELPAISDFPKLCKEQNLDGLNVTIPYKESIIDYLDELDEVAKEVGAVNTIVFNNGRTKGYNTDVIGFEKTIESLLESNHKKALILGTGGSSKAVQYVLAKLGIQFLFVSSRKNEQEGITSYRQLESDVVKKHHLIVNCTPVGMFPNVSEKPAIPYDAITSSHLVIDLIYNPPQTLFLTEALNRGATICNGHKMLVEQAEASWKIWNRD